MSWFDAVVVAVVALVLVLEIRQEAGKSLLDAVVALAALNFSPYLGSTLTQSLGWKPMHGTHAAPLALGLAFGGLLLVGLVVSALVHQRTRWSMEHYDVAFSAVFGLVMAVTLGHMLTDVTARQSLARDGKLPPYMQNSVVAEELRSFSSYYYVVNTLQGIRYEGQ